MEIDPGTVAFEQSELGGRTEIVKNAPYSAEAVSETVQTLTDGNRIVRQTRASIARDGYGRTRRERSNAGGKTTAHVFDPIDGKNFAMDADRQTAVRIPRVPSLVPSTPGLPFPPVPPVPSPSMPLITPGAPALTIPPHPPATPAPGAPRSVHARRRARAAGIRVERRRRTPQRGWP